MHFGGAYKVTPRQRVDLHFGAGLSPEANGRDAYIMKNILDDWDDERRVTIFKNCESAMTENAKFFWRSQGSFLRQAPRPEHGGISGGRERSDAEYRTLLDAVGLRVTKVVPTGRH